jgi:hypothetical protein
MVFQFLRVVEKAICKTLNPFLGNALGLESRTPAAPVGIRWIVPGIMAD